MPRFLHSFWNWRFGIAAVFSLLTAADHLRADALDNWKVNVITTNGSEPVASIAYGNGMYVVGGQDGGDPGYILSSPDAVTWNAVYHSTTNWFVPEVNCVTYHAGIFVAVGYDASLETSTNGINWPGNVTWVGSQPPPPIYNWNDVTWGNNMFVAVGDAQTYFGTNSNANIMTSPDGTNWTGRRSTTGTPVNISAIAYGNGLGFMAVGGSSYFTSPDGTNWTAGQAPTGLSHIAAGNGFFLVSTGTSTNLIVKSNFVFFPPSNWSFQNQSSGTSIGFGRLAFVNGLFIAAGHSAVLNTNLFLTSPDGTNWTQRSFYYGAAIYDTIFDGQRMVAVGYDSTSGNSLVFTSDPFVSLGVTFNGSPQLNISGLIEGSYRIDYLNTVPTNSSNNWQPLTNFTLPSSPYTVTDPQAGNSTSRYYRAVLLP